MDPVELIGLLALGFAAGMAGGLLGVGGGILFVPALVVFAGMSQIGAVATSLVAVVLVAVVGTWRQYGYGNVRLRDGLIIGVLSPLGLAGVVLANALPQGPSSCRSPACSSWWPGNSRGRRDCARLRSDGDSRGRQRERGRAGDCLAEGELDLSTVAKVEEELRRVEASEASLVVRISPV